MVGMESRNENLAAVVRLRPSSRAALMVTPERDVPGTSASAWARPMSRAWLKLSVSLVPRNRSAAPRSTPKPMVAQAMVVMDRHSPSTLSLNRKPAMTTGIVAAETFSSSSNWVSNPFPETNPNELET